MSEPTSQGVDAETLRLRNEVSDVLIPHGSIGGGDNDGIVSAINRMVARIAKLEAINNRLSHALELHRRFHGKVACPGGSDCYVCEYEASGTS